MGAGEGAISLGGLVGVLIHFSFVFALVAWGRRVARARNTRGWWIASYLPILGLAASMLGIIGTIIGLVQAFGAVAHADAAERATLLARGISLAMNATAAGLGIALVLYLVSVLAFLYGTYGPKPAAP